ncbi:MAG: Asp-tRNA(Asn) amidotransferase GatCAB subunit C [Nanoarchaeota archaeon]
MDQNKVKIEAKKILDRFAKALEKVKTKETEFYVDREEFERAEIKGKSEDFKSELLKNAPQKDSYFVIAEKGKWK